MWPLRDSSLSIIIVLSLQKVKEMGVSIFRILCVCFPFSSCESVYPPHESWYKHRAIGGRPSTILLICDKCHNSKCVIFQDTLVKVSKCYNFLWMQRLHNCSPAASFANCVMTKNLLKKKCVCTNVSFYTNNSKMPTFEFWHTCRKWAIFTVGKGDCPFFFFGDQ